MNRKILLQHLLLLALLVVQLNAANGQEAGKPFVLGVTDNIISKELGENRIVNIYLPEGYKQDSVSRYPVIYLLDGSADEDFIHVVGVVQFLTMIAAMPKTIVVGIANVDRRRDLTFPTTIDSDKKAYPTTGGSERFMNFIEKELQPYVQRTYRTNSSKTIIGQSLGGLFAMEVLFERPALFSNYIIVSPSLWWDGESLLKHSPRQLALPMGDNVRVYLSVGNEGKVMEGDARELANTLSTYEHLKLYFNPMPGENHLTILHRCVYDALEVLNGGK